ncbi:MAG: hypothetical protein HC837_02975 [Chloroflexaceae bacterium]|nr:hypothetical protein [Chloroflexaceae bacterium]
MADLPERRGQLPIDLRTVFDHLFFIERVQGKTCPPDTMHPWILHHFGALEPVIDQTIVKVTNRWTLEATLYNPLRARRPNAVNADPIADAALEERIAADSGDNDTFSDPLHGTTADVFGRIRGKHCMSASNVAKYDGWHGLVIFDTFHPLHVHRDHFHDYIDVALRWLQTAHRHDPAACYPLITWNCLWKSGATITHGHMQMILSQGMPAGQVERWRRVTAQYRVDLGRSYFSDIARLCRHLGLTFCDHDLVQGYASLTPIKDRELLLFAPASVVDLQPLWDAAYTALRHLIDQQGVRSFNLAVYLPPMVPTQEPWDDLPICVRIVDRGNPLSPMVNVGAMEVFASSVVTADPFQVAALLRDEKSYP